jgi:hypothetical protein
MLQGQLQIMRTALADCSKQKRPYIWVGEVTIGIVGKTAEHLATRVIIVHSHNMSHH